MPTHAARQLPTGRWSSKLGPSEDIEHDLHALEGEIYGTIALKLAVVLTLDGKRGHFDKHPTAVPPVLYFVAPGPHGG
ncbi:MAG: hypothetical protein L0Y72_23715 [Gemmataceae bacterium]|nr:hypothetical protein [Gemmataceae bacterium]MCI0742052.1 hypothetical protein [Gemmataceae bacterium]